MVRKKIGLFGEISQMITIPTGRLLQSFSIW